MAHFAPKSALLAHCISKYSSLALLDFEPNCTHIRDSYPAKDV